MIKIFTYILICFFVLCLQSCTQNEFPETAVEGFLQLDNSLMHSNEYLIHIAYQDISYLKEILNEKFYLKPLERISMEADIASDEFYDFMDDLKWEYF